MTKRNRFYRQAELDAMVRYNPEAAALVELQLQAQQNLKSSVRSAKGNARGIIAETKRVEPQVANLYDKASEAQGVAAARIASNTNSLGPVADDLKFAVGGEAANAATRIAEARAASLADLKQRRVGAREGQQFAVQAARSQFATEIGQVLRRKQSLGAEIGAYKASQAGDLREDAKKRKQARDIVDKQLAQSERNSVRTNSRLERAAQQRAQGEDRPRLTPLQHAAAADKIAEAASWGTRLKTAGLSFADAKRALAEGRDEVKPQPKYDPKTGDKVIGPDGAAVMIPGRPGVPKVESELLLQAALETAYNGRVSVATRKKLRRRGLKPRALNIPLGKAPVFNTGGSFAPGANGQLRPN